MKDSKIWTGIGVGIVAIIVVIVAAIVPSSLDSENKNTNTSVSDSDDIVTRAQKESESVKDSEKKDFVDIDVNKFKELYSGSENSIVLFSRPTCGYCQVAEPILMNLAYKYKFDIYHLNTDNMSEDDFNNLSSINEAFESFGTPFLVVVSNNKIVDSVSGLNDTSGYKKFFKKYNFINE